MNSVKSPNNSKNDDNIITPRLKNILVESFADIKVFKSSNTFGIYLICIIAFKLQWALDNLSKRKPE